MNAPEVPEAALAALRDLYAGLDAELAALAPRCELSGRCCDFRRSGHVLFATDVELAHLARRAPPAVEGAPDLCPWWSGGRCHAREGRPLGCRLYFCDASKRDELEALSMRAHARLKELHDAAGASYRYGPFVPAAHALLAVRPRR